MTGHSDIDRLVKEATEDLRDDLELRLDVSAELAAHLQDSVEEFRKSGYSEQESVKRAFDAFGAPSELRQALASANRRRMKTRARARVMLRGLLVPASFAAAVFLTWGLMVRYNNVVQAYNRVVDLPPPLPTEPREMLRRTCFLDYADPVDRLPPDSAFLFKGDTTRPLRSLQQRAIWEAAPMNKVYFGNFVTELFAARKQHDPGYLQKETEHGAKLEPDNARYDYLPACALAEQAGRLERLGPGRFHLKYVVSDGNLLDSVLTAIMKGNAKPSFRRYALEMHMERLALLPAVTRVEERAERLLMTSRLETPDNSILVFLSIVAADGARYLARNGKEADALRLLETWTHLARGLNYDAFSTADIETVGMIAESAIENTAPVFEELGRPDSAEAVRQLANEVLAVTQTSDANRFGSSGMPGLESASVLASMASRSFSSRPSGNVFLFGRMAEHALLKEAATGAAVLALIGLMAISWLVATRNRTGEGVSDSSPFLLIGRRELVRILAIGLVIPMSAYWVYSRFTHGIMGGNSSIAGLAPRLFLETFLIIATILELFSLAAEHALRRHCEILRVPAPRQHGLVIRLIPATLLAVLWVGCLAVLPAMDRPPAGAFAVPALLLAAGWSALRLGPVLRGLFLPRQHKAFFRTIARSLIPVYAAAALCLGLCAYPLLRLDERQLLRKERLYSEDAGGMLANADFARALNARSRLGRILKEEGQRDNGTTGQQDNGTTGPRDNGTTGQQDNGTTGPRDNGTTGQQDNRTTGQRDNGTTANAIATKRHKRHKMQPPIDADERR